MEEMRFIGTMREIKAKLAFMPEAEGTFELNIKPYRAKRSLNANAYLWALVGKIADLIREDKNAVYKFMLERYGQYEVIEMRSDINPRRWFKYIEPLGKVQHDGMSYNQFRAWRGSSEYDTREMAILLDGVINEATNLGIATITDEELNRMKGSWGK